jgi:hypothetical protein
MPSLRYIDIEPVLRAQIEHVLALAALMAEAARLRREDRVREARRLERAIVRAVTPAVRR